MIIYKYFSGLETTETCDELSDKIVEGIIEDNKEIKENLNVSSKYKFIFRKSK